jgi:hypothetical protein
MSNAFNASLVPMPPSPVLAPQQPTPFGLQPQPQPSLYNVNPLLNKIQKPLPGAQFKAAFAPKPQAAAPAAPGAAATPPDPTTIGPTYAEKAMQQSDQDYQAARAKLNALPPYQDDTPPYQAPALTQPNKGETLGHMLAALLSPRLGPAAVRGMQYDQSEDQRQDTLNEQNAQIAETAAQAQANRQEHAYDTQLTKLTADVDATERAHEKAVDNFDLSVSRGQTASAAMQRADTAATKVINDFQLGSSNLALKQKQLAIIANNDAAKIGIANKGLVLHQWQIGLDAYDTMTKQKISSGTALQVANMHVKAQLQIAKMNQEYNNNRAVFKQNYQGDVAMMNQVQKQISTLMAQAQLPGADTDAIQAATVPLQKQLNAAMQKVSADSGGVVQPVQTSIGADLQSTVDGAYDDVTNAPIPAGGNVTNNYYGGAEPQMPPGPLTASGGLTGTPGGTTTPAGQLQSFLQLQGGGQPGQPGAPGAGSGAIAPHPIAPLPQVNPQDLALAKQHAAEIQQRGGNMHGLISAFAANNHLTPQQAHQLLGIPMPQAQAPARVSAQPPPVSNGPIAGLQLGGGPQPPSGVGQMAFSGPPNNAPPTPPQGASPAANAAGTPPQAPSKPPNAAQTTPAQRPQTPLAPAQYAAAIAKAADAKDGANAPPPEQKMKMLAGALMKKYPGMSQTNAMQIAAQVVGQQRWGNAMSGAINAGSAVTGAIGGAVHGLGNAAQNFEKGWMGPPPPNPPPAAGW